MNKQMISEWRHFLNEGPVSTQELSDEVIALLFSDELDDIMSKSGVNEGIRDRAKNLAKKYGIPLTVALSLLSGAYAGQKFADFQNARQPAQVADEPQPGDYAYHSAKSSRPPGYSDLSNSESIEQAWADLESLKRERAPVSGEAPTLINGQIKILKFAYIPADIIPQEAALPMSQMTAGEYRQMLEARLLRGEQEIVYLKGMIFGDTGKWASGSGNEQFRTEGNYALLPPEWSIAHEVYANAVEGRVRDILGYVRDNPESRQEIYQQIGVENDDQFHEFMNDQLYKIGRQ